MVLCGFVASGRLPFRVDVQKDLLVAAIVSKVRMKWGDSMMS